MKVVTANVANVHGPAAAASSPDLGSSLMMIVVRWVIAKGGDRVVEGAVYR